MIVAFVDEIDEEERIMLDDGEFEDIEEEVVEEDEAVMDRMPNTYAAVAEEESVASREDDHLTRSICNLSLVDVEFSSLAFPFIWSVSQIFIDQMN